MKSITAAVTLVVFAGLPAWAQQAPAGQPQAASNMMAMHHDHASGPPVSYAELKDTVGRLERARQATAKYQDARVAEADDYRAIGPDVPGMGIHYVLSATQAGFDVEKPPILLYEKNPSAPGGFSLVGVSYLLTAA